MEDILKMLISTSKIHDEFYANLSIVWGKKTLNFLLKILFYFTFATLFMQTHSRSNFAFDMSQTDDFFYRAVC